MLNNLSEKLDSATIEVFKCLDQIKKDNVIENKQYAEKTNKDKSSVTVQTEKRFSNSTSKSINITANIKKSTVITPSTKDDDEWESF